MDEAEAPPPEPYDPATSRFARGAGLGLSIGCVVMFPLGFGMAVTAAMLGAPRLGPWLMFGPMVLWGTGLAAFVGWWLLMGYRAGLFDSGPPDGPPRPARGVVLGGPLDAEPAADPDAPLPHPLPPAGPNPWGQAGCLLIALAVLVPLFGGTIVAGWQIVRVGGFGWLGQAPGLLFTAAILFVVGGFALEFLKSTYLAVVGLAVGRIDVSASADRVRPGGRIGLRVGRPGGVGLAGPAVVLLCREEVTVSDGEGDSTSVRVLARYPVAVDGLPAAVAVRFPADAIPTYIEGGTRIEWRVRVSGRAFGVLPYSREFAGPAVPAADPGPGASP